MSEFPPTSPSLLVRLRDPQDAIAWDQFVEIYAPIVYRFARSHRLQDADAADLSQDVLRSVYSAIGRLDYDPRRGSFRAWLLTITRNRLRNFLKSKDHARTVVDAESVERRLAESAPDDELSRQWDEEYERSLFAWAVERVRGSFQGPTWSAFWAAAVEGKSPAAVAKATGLSVGAVYIAKSRVLARLRETVEQVDGESSVTVRRAR